MPSPTAFPRLSLPNELFHRIITFVIADSVHSICVSPADTTWDMNILSTLHDVSPLFRAISTEVVRKAFDIPRVNQPVEPSSEGDLESLVLHTLPKILTYLHDVGTRLRHPSDWGRVSFQVINCPAGSFVLAYMLYMSCVSLRRNAAHSPVEVFLSTHQAIFAALEQSLSLCDGVVPVQITGVLYESIRGEVELSRYGLEIVKGFVELEEQANSIIALKDSIAENAMPLELALFSIDSSLAKVELANVEYRRAHNSDSTHAAQVFELPGVLPTLRKIHGLNLVEGEYKLVERVQALVDEWSDGCPFLNPKIE